MKENKKNIQALLKLLVQFAVPVVLFYLVEFYEHNPFQEVRSGAQFYNVLILELLGWGLFFVCNSIRISLGILTILTMLFGLINHYVYAFRSTPFVPWDLYSIKTAASVAGNYDFTPSTRVVVVTLIFLAIFAGLMFVRFSLKLKIYIRLIPALCVFLVLGLFAHTLQQESFQKSHYLYPYLFTPAYMTQVNGMICTFTMDLAYINVDKPSGYHESQVAEDYESYVSEAEETSSETDTADYPNIIVIMDEAFSDVGILSDFTTNTDYMPFVHSLLAGADNTVSGYLNVSVCGGNTANTEFEFLTGNSMAFLPTGSIPYQQYVKSETPSLASHLKELGYETYAMHPYYSTGWNRDTVYPLLGFDNLIFNDNFTGATYLRTYISDQSDFNMIKKLYENKGDSPMFLFNVTMQNHGSYTDQYTNFTPDVSVDGVSNFALNQYLSLIKVTDTDVNNLLSFFSLQDEHTIIVFFGDHQPNDSTVSGIYSGSGDAIRYKVPFFIWANYDIEEETGVETSANFLATRLLEEAGVPLSGYETFLTQVSEDYPVYSAITQEQVGDESGDLLAEYKKLQYYLLFDYEEEE